MLNSRKATKVKGKFVKKSLTQKTEKRLKPNERSARTPMQDRLQRKSGKIVHESERTSGIQVQVMREREMNKRKEGERENKIPYVKLCLKMSFIGLVLLTV